MVDCVRASIPDELIESKGNFTCKDDYVPTGNLVGYRAVPYPTYPYPSDCDNRWLYNGIPSSFPLTLISDSDEFKSWQSEEFTTEDSPIVEASFQTWYIPKTNLIGMCTQFPSTNPPYGWEVPVQFDGEYWTGEHFNTGWCGRTLQFYFNLYKKYCCVLDDRYNVTDYYFNYYYTIFQVIDGVLDKHCGCGEANFCTDILGNGIGLGNQYQSQYSCYMNVRSS